MPRKDGPIARLGWMDDAGEFSVERPGPNRLAADDVIAAVSAQFADVDGALLVGFVMLAEAVDADPTNAALWGQYRAAETVIREAASGGDDDFAKLIAGLSADVRNAEVVES
jgi:hypothetical protein